MAADSKPLGQQYHEDVESLKADGMSNADAVREVAKKYGKKENAIRGGIHQYKRSHLNGGSAPTRRSRRTSAVSVEDYVANAWKALESALDAIDRDVEQKKAELAAAQAAYDEAVASVKERKAAIKADIEKKLKALA